MTIDLNQVTEKSVGAFLYPKRIIIEIKNKQDDFTWYTTGNFTELPITISNSELGNTILDNLQKSSHESIPPDQIKVLWEGFKKKAKFKTEKSFMFGAKYVSIFMRRNEIRFEPWKNKFSRHAFYKNPESISVFEPIPLSEFVGEALRRSWDSCIFID